MTARDQLINAVPSELKDKQIEVWPLGFGSADTASLNKIARDGYPGAGRCELPATPSADAPRTGEDLLAATGRTVAALTPLNQCRATATVRIPLPATDATIHVGHEDRLTVGFCEPHPVGGPRDCSDRNIIRPGKTASDSFTFEPAPAAGGYDRLHITRPMPGEWTVVATAPPGGPPIMIDPQVEWEGTPRTAMLVRPAPPLPGAAGGPPMVNVEARLYTRADALKIPGALAGVTAEITLNYGSDDQSPVMIGPKPRFAADSGGSDIVVFAAPVALPVNATGHLDFTAVISWPSGTKPTSTRLTYSTSVKEMVESRAGAESLPSVPIVTIPNLNGPLPRGGMLSGYVTVTGRWDNIGSITLEPAAEWKALGVTMDPVTLNKGDVRDGEPVKLTIHASDNALPGPVGGIIQAFDTSPAHRLLGDQFVDLTIVPFAANSPTDQWMVAFFVLLGIIFATCASIGLLEYQKRRAVYTTVDGLTVWLYHDNAPCDVLEPSAPSNRQLSFEIHGVDDSSDVPPRFSTPRAEEPPIKTEPGSTCKIINLWRNSHNGTVQLGSNTEKLIDYPINEDVAYRVNARTYLTITDSGRIFR